jgi:hypothetical protein
MTKPLGSISFGTNVIRTDEYAIAAKVMRDNGSSLEVIACELTAWDDMLSLIRIQALIVGSQYTKTGRLRKNSTLQSLLEQRLDLLITELKECSTVEQEETE